MSQETFAQLVGVSVRTIAGWETGRNKPRGLSVRRLDEVRKMAGLDIVDDIKAGKLAKSLEKND
jgi:DNA-binding transcriptional regulator YiaG